jgi:uncharacterized protein (TIRG00374 family)
LYFVLRGVQWGEVWAHLKDVDMPMFGFSMLLMLAAYFLMALRWQHLLDPLHVPGPGNRPSLGEVAGVGVGRDLRRYENPLSLYAKMMTGYFFNAFLPARAGDLVRAYLLSRSTGLRKTTVLATVVLEKTFDGLALLLMLLLSLMLLPSTTPTIGIARAEFAPEPLAWAAGIGLVALTLALALFYTHNRRIATLVEKLVSLLPIPDKLGMIAIRLVHTFAGGMHVFRSPGPLVSAATISVMVWLVVVAMFWAALTSFGTPFPTGLVSPVGLLFMTSVVNLGLLIPALPGNVGTYEALCLTVLAFYGVDKELAVAFALIFHVGQLVTTLVAGLIAFWTQNLSLAEVRPIQASAQPEPELQPQHNHKS